MHELYELKEKLMAELKEYGSQDEMTSSTLDVVDKLAHTIKNLCKIIDDMEGYSERGSYESSMRGGSYDGSMRGSYRDGSYGDGSFRGSYDSSMRGGSYARGGRGRGARRDSRGRYASDNGMMLEELQELMSDAPDDRTRQEIQKLVTRLEQM